MSRWLRYAAGFLLALTVGAFGLGLVGGEVRLAGVQAGTSLRVVHDQPGREDFRGPRSTGSAALRPHGYDQALTATTALAGFSSDARGGCDPTGHPSLLRTSLSIGVLATKGAESSLQGALLREDLRLTEKYGSGGVRELENGSRRYYGDLRPSRTPGEMAGQRTVREWNTATGAQRTWLETLDQQGRVRIVRPQTGGPKTHYYFDQQGGYGGSR